MRGLHEQDTRLPPSRCKDGDPRVWKDGRGKEVGGRWGAGRGQGPAEGEGEIKGK